ncbi:MAG: hypothetical protein IGS48_14795 [Oscillatoriales cyanobacterium C42_A2020_001]|nr:hypothetical protein [Leptolyngbyaceae cyanobacterium C42_A2020_001]
MRRMPPRSRFGSRRKFEAIAAVTILALLGMTIKPSTKTKAGSLDTPPTQEKKLQATSTARVLQREKQLRQIRPENYDLDKVPITAENEDHWRHLLWTTAVVEPREPFVAEALNQILMMTNRSGLSVSQARTVDQAMKVATQLYLSDPNFYGSVAQRFVETIEQSPEPEWVAVALSGLAKGKLAASELARLSGVARSRFPNWTSNVYLQTTLQDITDITNERDLPSLKELLNWEIAPRQVHLYVLCRDDRRVLCQTILKDRNGNFIQQGDKLWSVPLLLESIHELGWNFTRGQTPQGIFRIEGTIPQPDDEFFRAYGQFPLINLYVPFEAGAKQFLPGRAGSFTGNLADYQALLPPSWRNHRALHQSYWAGKAGRGLFRIHGSGESVDFFRGKDRNVPESYNWNPTIGCLSARELYNERGQLVHADMPKILKALHSVGGKNFAGYLIVVNVPANEPKPISLQAIEAAIKPPTQRSHRSHTLPARLTSRTLTSSRSRVLLAKSVESSRKMTLQVGQLVNHMERLELVNPESGEKKPIKPSTAELKPLPVAY